MWQQSTLNGGGFIAGILQDPSDPNIIFARSDVAGVFKSVDGGKTWQPRNHGMTDCHQHDVRSFAISPHDHRVLFRCSGSVRGGRFFGTIHKSIDGGDYWYPVCRDVDFYGNGETRQYGEIVQVHPHDPTFVAAGGYSGGLWVSSDTGENWTYAGLKAERIACVYFYPIYRNVLYVGTIGKFDSDPEFVSQQYDFVRPNPPRLYCSPDCGKTWELMYEGMDFAEIVIDPTSPDTIYAACLKDGVMKSVDGGRTWISKTTDLSKYPIGTVTIDPHNPASLYAAAETFPNFDSEVPPIGVYCSKDCGDSWELIRWHHDEDIHNYPSYMTLPYAGWAIAKIRVDICDSRKLYISNWYGVAISHDNGLTWDANHFSGMENVCVENILIHPAKPDTVFMVMADHSPKVSVDGGHTFQSLQYPKMNVVQPDSTAVVASRYHPELVLYAMKGPSGCSIAKTTLDGLEPRIVFQQFALPDTPQSRLAFQSRAAGVSVQSLAEDPFEPGKFYAYLDGVIEYGSGLYQSIDWGETWSYVSTVFPAYIKRIPHKRHWIENELLSVVIAQTKNVCGTNQLLCIDPHRKGTLYIGEWTEGLFRSTNGGSTWQDISQGLPFKRDQASVLNVIRADEHQPGVLYAGFIREGLWRSHDYGGTWEKIFPLTDKFFNATSVAVGGKDGKLVVVVSEPLYWSPCESSVYVSQDHGCSWRNIYDTRLGAIRWKSVAVEPDVNRIYAASCGNSVFYLTLEG